MRLCPTAIRWAVALRAPSLFSGATKDALRPGRRRITWTTGNPARRGFSSLADVAHRGREHKARGAMLAHRADHLLLANRVLRGVGKEGDIGAALARLLDTDRELDIEGVRQVVDDHADHAGLGAAQGRRAAMIDVAELGHRVGDALACRSRQRASFRREPGRRSISRRRPGGRHRRWSRAPREPPSPCVSRRSLWHPIGTFQFQVEHHVFQQKVQKPAFLPLELERAKSLVAVLCRPVNPSQDQT